MILLAAACVDESDHLTLVNAGDEEVVSQEEGEGGGALWRGGEEGVVARALSHTCGHTGRARTVLVGSPFSLRQV